VRWGIGLNFNLIERIAQEMKLGRALAECFRGEPIEELKARVLEARHKYHREVQNEFHPFDLPINSPKPM